MSERKSSFLGMSLDELSQLCSDEGLPRFAARQICEWIYKKRVSEISQMTNLSKAVRSTLSERYEVGRVAPIKVSVASDGTKKYLYRTSRASYIESVYIPDGDRATLCISSQAGCRMGCKFCATARQGLQHSLSASEIVNQIISTPEFENLTNIVYMGMGEPLDNMDSVLASLSVITSAWGLGWSPRRVTLSTAGVTPQLDRLLRECDVDVAVSLHNPISDERAEIMPIERAYPIAEVVEQLRGYDFSGQRRLSFEYIILSGASRNNTPRHIKHLMQLLNGMKCRINIIKFHKIPSSPYYSPEEDKIVSFRDELTKRGIQTTIRRSRGEDIEAACGLLSTLSTVSTTK